MNVDMNANLNPNLNDIYDSDQHYDISTSRPLAVHYCVDLHLKCQSRIL